MLCQVLVRDPYKVQAKSADCRLLPVPDSGAAETRPAHLIRRRRGRRKALRQADLREGPVHAQCTSSTPTHTLVVGAQYLVHLVESTVFYLGDQGVHLSDAAKKALTTLVKHRNECLNRVQRSCYRLVVVWLSRQRTRWSITLSIDLWRSQLPCKFQS